MKSETIVGKATASSPLAYGRATASEGNYEAGFE